MDNDLLEALYDMITEFDEDNYTKNKKKEELKGIRHAWLASFLSR